MRLCEVIPLKPLGLNFFGIDFPSHTRSQLSFINLNGKDNRTNGKAHRSHERTPPPKLPTPTISRPPPTYHLYTAKVRARRAISRRRAPLEECFPCVSQIALTLFFLIYCHNIRGRGGRSKETEATTTTKTAVAAATGGNPLHFLVSMKVRLDGRVCNTLLIFIVRH